ncbi:hypothetical protein BV25DRAFT_1823584 [Artomyces pyxidatus]|uniref:Uncharacterized protein n=1 Tax=Artomyces pyxidatus TaxID=48021 RepID=A0ACB8T751_9AGAM|nr:hypothetical protein BV25DRAFT_1823584 [Artomyces pyxidatus]
MTTHSGILSELSGSYVSGVSRPFGWRRKQLQGIHDLIQNDTDVLVDAALRDKRLVRADVLLELASILSLVKTRLDSVIRESNEAPAAPTGILGASGDRKTSEAKTPTGIAVVVAHWAFPYSSSLGAMALAYAAGNVVALVPPQNASVASILSAKLRTTQDHLGYAVISSADALKGSIQQQSEANSYPSITVLDVRGNGTVEHPRTVYPSRNPSAVYVNYTALGGRDEVKFTPRRTKIAKDIARTIVQSKTIFNGHAFHAPMVAFLDSEIYDELVAQIVTAVKDMGGSANAGYGKVQQTGLKSVVEGPISVFDIDAKTASDVKLPSLETPVLLLSKATTPDTAIDRLQYLPRLPAFYLFAKEPFTSYVVKNIDSDLTVVNDIPIDVLANPFAPRTALLSSVLSTPQSIVTLSGPSPSSSDMERKLVHAIASAQITRLDEGPGTRWDFFDQVKLVFTGVKYLGYASLAAGGYLAYRRFIK